MRIWSTQRFLVSMIFPLSIMKTTFVKQSALSGLLLSPVCVAETQRTDIFARYKPERSSSCTWANIAERRVARSNSFCSSLNIMLAEKLSLDDIGEVLLNDLPSSRTEMLLWICGWFHLFQPVSFPHPIPSSQWKQGKPDDHGLGTLICPSYPCGY